MDPSREVDYNALLAFRTALRKFNHWSEQQARTVGLTHAQHQLLLAIKGHDGAQSPTIGEVADYLLLRHHSAVELANRVQAAGLITRQRDGSDARVVRLALTADGERCLRELSQLHLSELRQLAPLLQHVVGSGQLQHGPLG
jgi:DNA-binding MarR family transcriptional regulator